MTDRREEQHDGEEHLPEHIPLEEPEVEDEVDLALAAGVDRLVAESTAQQRGGSGAADPLTGVDSGQRQLAGSGPTLPPRNQGLVVPERPKAGHPNLPPTEEFLSMASKVRVARGAFMAARMRAYDHVNMDAPVITLRGNTSREIMERNY